MNCKQLIAGTLVTLSVTAGIAGTPLTTAHATARLRNFPKALRGTWYNYSYGKLYRTKITARKIVGNDYVNRLHVRKVGDYPRVGQKQTHPSWVMGSTLTYHGEHWTHTSGWYSTAGAGNYYRVTHRQLNGHKRAVMQFAGGAGIWTYSYGFHTKALAKRYAQAHFSGDRFN